MTRSRPGGRDGATMPLIPAADNNDRAAVGFDVRTLRRITALAFKHRARMYLAIAATIVAGLAQIVIPQLIGAAVDHAHRLLDAAISTGQREASSHGLLVIAGWLFFVAVLRGVVTMVQNYQGEAVGHLLANELRLDYYRQLQRLAFRYHDETHTGELMTRGILDIEGTRMWVHTGILRLFLLIVLIGGGAAMLLSVNVGLTLVALAFVPIVAVGASVARLRLRELWYRLQRELGILTRIMEENLGGIRVVRAFGAEKFELARFDQVSAIALAITHKRIALFVTSTTTMTFMFFLSMGLVLWYGGELVIEDQITIGELAAFLAFMTILQQPVRQIAWMVNSIARASTCGARLFDILDLEPEIADHPGACDLPQDGDGVLRFEHVDFSYARGDAQANSALALKDVNFAIGPGQVLGIVGPPGSGKSSVVSLVPRFYDVNAGRISISGVDIRELKLESLRNFVSIVQQDAFLFTAAIETNVAYANPWAAQASIVAATTSAQLAPYIEQLPDGYTTLVGERGVSLSGGQRQRLAIARSVLPHSGVLILDDATAAVDAGTEQQIRTALKQYAADRVTIIIAHRLSSLMHADEILFVENGQIVERGTHHQLVELGGKYAALHGLQSFDTASAAPEDAL
jgi:ATP-binding cassette, subfamily B, multidrug efflux pump